MKKIILTVSILSTMMLSNQSMSEVTKTYAPHSTYIPFPEGYGYNKNTEALQKATDKGDKKLIREHAWSLWAGIMQSSEKSDWPLWITWPNSHTAFSNSNDKLTVQNNKTRKLKQSTSLKTFSRDNMSIVEIFTKSPTYYIPLQVIQKYPNAICSDEVGSLNICDGKTFLNNGDIMIPTESLSIEAMNDIRQKKLYLKSTLNAAYKKGERVNMAKKSIVTKHMYWPVKANGITAIPVWKNNYPDDYTNYAGYEKWNTLIALSPDGMQKVGDTVSAKFLYDVNNYAGDKALDIISTKAVVHSLEEFYYHKVTQEDWNNFDEADKAIITTSSLRANNKIFEVGDYLVSVAMHINTKELSSWTMQSVWWSDTPNEGPYATYRPDLPQASGPWKHYLLTDVYATPKNAGEKLDKGVNPYIEGVIHPISTNCRNCHVRAGWPRSLASYQNPACPDSLANLTPNSACLSSINLTDYLWIIPDRAR